MHACGCFGIPTKSFFSVCVSLGNMILSFFLKIVIKIQMSCCLSIHPPLACDIAALTCHTYGEHTTIVGWAKITLNQKSLDDGGPSSNRYIYNVTPIIKPEIAEKKIGSREFKNQRTMKSPVRLYILERTVKVYHDTSVIWLLNWDSRKENTKKQANMKEKNLTRPQVYSELQATTKNAEGGRISSPRDWAPLLVIGYWLSSTKFPGLKFCAYKWHYRDSPHGVCVYTKQLKKRRPWI